MHAPAHLNFEMCFVKASTMNLPYRDPSNMQVVSQNMFNNLTIQGHPVLVDVPGKRHHNWSRSNNRALRIGVEA